MPSFTESLEEAIHRALEYASERRQEFATLEHLLLSLIDDKDASAVMRACGVNLEILRKQLIQYIDTDLDALIVSEIEDVQPTTGFQRVVQRALIHVQSSGREEVTGANVLVAIFAERESHAAFFLLDVLTGVSAAFVTDLTLAGDFGSFLPGDLAFDAFLPFVGDSGASSLVDLALDDMFARLRGDGARARVGRGVVIFVVEVCLRRGGSWVWGARARRAGARRYHSRVGVDAGACGLVGSRRTRFVGFPALELSEAILGRAWR